MTDWVNRLNLEGTIFSVRKLPRDAIEINLGEESPLDFIAFGLRQRKQGNDEWTETERLEMVTTLSGLEPLTVYQWQSRTITIANPDPDWSDVNCSDTGEADAWEAPTP